MKSGSELVKASFRAFFENASEDLEKLVEMLKLGKFMQSRAQMKSVSQSVNYVTVALLPILTALFEHIKSQDFGVDLLCEFVSTKENKYIVFTGGIYCIYDNNAGQRGRTEKQKRIGQLGP